MKQKSKNWILECFLCHSTFHNKVSNLRRHIRLHDSSNTCFECLGCHNTYQNKQNLKKHWIQKHSKIEPPRMIETVRKSGSKQNISICEKMKRFKYVVP